MSLHPIRPRLGVDVGRVLVGAIDEAGHADTSFLSGSDEHALSTPPEAGALDAVRALCAAFEGEVWIVSKCGPRIEALTRRWLARHGFVGPGVVRGDRLRFVRKRPEKRGVAVDLRLTHFVDDRLDVLEPMVSLVPYLYRFGRTHHPCPAWASPVLDWARARPAIERTLAEAAW